MFSLGSLQEEQRLVRLSYLNPVVKNDGGCWKDELGRV
jgi:hypothetical protein